MKELSETLLFHRFTNPRRDKSVYYRALSSVYTPSMINLFIFGHGVVIYCLIKILIWKKENAKISVREVTNFAKGGD